MHYFGREYYRKDTILINFSYTTTLAKLFFNEILLNNLKIDLEYKHHFGDPYLFDKTDPDIIDFDQFKKDYLSITLTLDMKITTLWTISISYSVRNSAIYKYFYEVDDTHRHVDFFQDLIDAFNLWDEAALRGTNWKMKHLNFTITHDLAEWLMTFTIGLSPVAGNTMITFQPTISLSIVFLDLAGFDGGINGDGVINQFFYDRL
jgi:alkylhydroperoxidase/carboxymuconolactone decarboxylase family protein YurZ